MTLSNTIKKRFIKDYNLPIQVVQEPYFTYAIETLDTHLGTKSKLQLLMDVVTELGSEDKFFSEANKVKDPIINSIQLKGIYDHLSADPLNAYEVITNGVRTQDIYNMGNVNKTFISLDLKHANFNVFRMYDPELVLGFDTYEDMIGSVTKFDYFKKSKYLRQVIFGNMLPKKQQRLQKWVMSQIISVLHNDVGIAMTDFVSASADEVVFAVDPKDIDLFVDMVSRKVSSNELTKDMTSWIRIEAFTLKSIGDKKFFVKELSNGSVEFKGIQSYFFMQVYKKYTKQPIIKDDKIFYFDGMLATFEKEVFDDTQEIIED